MQSASEFLSRLARWLVSVAIFGALLFGLAGRRDLPMLWAFWGVCAVLALAVILTIDPELAQERRRPGPGGVDRRRRLLFALLFVSTLALASLDVGRRHWSDTVPLGIQATALGVAAGAMGVLVWAVAVNRFFSPVVRIQTERGHHLVDRGPYRLVRHPGYLGMFLALPASALALGVVVGADAGGGELAPGAPPPRPRGPLLRGAPRRVRRLREDGQVSARARGVVSV